MKKRFNVTGACNPKFHYMVNIDKKLFQIKNMIDRGDYFTINRSRQYGKSTTLGALKKILKDNYIVFYLDFQNISHVNFQTEGNFTKVIAQELRRCLEAEQRISVDLVEELDDYIEQQERHTMYELFLLLKQWCKCIEYPIVLMIDEVDSASNNQVFLDFLAYLRAGFIARQMEEEPTFLSVILAGVHDIKHIKAKINLADNSGTVQKEAEIKKTNSPWNTREGNEPSESLLSFGDCPWDHREFAPYDIAADFRVDMSFDKEGIAGMLHEYENDQHTGMDIEELAELIYDYTAGYPYLVSRICYIIDEILMEQEGNAAWSKTGFLRAIKELMFERNTLFESLIHQFESYPELRFKILEILFRGESVPYNPDIEVIHMAQMYGFIINQHGQIAVSNRIFEIRLYNYFLAEQETEQTELFKIASQERNQFIKYGKLDMKLVLEKFVCCFNELYGGKTEKFLEEEGRRYFLLFLRPIINGTGNYYIEAQTRDAKRTDVIVDYCGEQFVIELKIWNGASYNSRGEEQLAEYLEYYHLDKGYMVSFNFNKKKQVGVKEVQLGNKLLIEAVV